MAIPRGITMIECDDPTGNGEDACEIVRVKDDGTVLHSGHFFFYHANQRVRAYQSNASTDAGELFDITTDDQDLPGGNGRLVVQSA